MALIEETDARVAPSALPRRAHGALANVLRHSGASRAKLTLSYLGAEVALDVVDDGVGFDPSAAPQDELEGVDFGIRARLDASHDDVERLTACEGEVLTRVAEGRSNRDIGRALFLSEATVKPHLVHIFAKLDVGSRTAAVARARELGAIRAG